MGEKGFNGWVSENEFDSCFGEEGFTGWVRRGLIDGWLKKEGEEKERVEKRLGG